VCIICWAVIPPDSASEVAAFLSAASGLIALGWALGMIRAFDHNAIVETRHELLPVSVALRKLWSLLRPLHPKHVCSLLVPTTDHIVGTKAMDIGSAILSTHA